MRRVLVFHRDHCLACRSCELACSVAHSESGELEAAIAEECPPVRRVVVASGSDALWGSLASCAPVGNRRNGRVDNPLQVNNLPHIEAHRCEQCLEPLCAFACKSGALRRDPLTGIVSFDEARCVACFMSLTVCPSGLRPDPAKDRVVRCDVCGDL